MPGYTPAAQAVLQRAQEEAGRLGHPLVQREHLFLGLLADSAVIRILNAMGADPRSIRESVESHLPPALGAPVTAAIDLLPTADQVYRQRAHAAATMLNHSQIGTLDILLGFLLEQHGLVPEVLGGHGITPIGLVDAIQRLDVQGG